MSVAPIDIRHIRARRRLSTPSCRPPPSRLTKICHPLPHSLEALDLSTPSPTQSLASLRFLILSYLADLEERLAKLASATPVIDGSTFEEARACARTALEMLKSIRADVCSHLPEFHFADMEVVESFIKSHLPDFDFDLCVPRLRIPDMPDVRSRLPDINIEYVRSSLPCFPSMEDVRSRLSDFDFDVKSRLPDLDFDLPGFYDLDFAQPLSYIPKLSAHLQTLHSHLATLPSTWGFPGFPIVFDESGSEQCSRSGSPSIYLTPGTLLSDLLSALLSPSCPDNVLLQTPAISDCGGDGYIHHPIPSPPKSTTMLDKAEKTLSDAAADIKAAIQHSLEGGKLIMYEQLPVEWRNNPFVHYGYRFIPLDRWHLIPASLFQFHNETLNIHTHLIPFALWSISLLSFISLPSLPTVHIPFPPVLSSAISHVTTSVGTWTSGIFDAPPLVDTPETLFMLFALLCLFSSAIWHTMAGCAHHRSMEFCARVDYVGIGWLISASVGTVVHYGYQCHPNISAAFLAVCFCTGLAGNICPFMQWFNMYEYRIWRIAFFLSLAFSALAPLAGLAILRSPKEMISFIAPVGPSLLSYIIGLVFYATHVPERWLSDTWRRRLDSIGGGSHSIWHCFIVLAVSQHKAAIKVMRDEMLSGSACLAS